MRLLTVDIGTNSTLYLICDIKHDKLTLLTRGIFPNQLGSTMGSNNRIPDSIIEENLSILSSILEKARLSGCEKIGGVGTHALRKAVNGGDLINGAAQLGLSIEIIDGEREAYLNWIGLFGQTGPVEKTAILDVGGGSTELIIGKRWDIEFKESIPLGAVTLTRELNRDTMPVEESDQFLLRMAREFERWRGLFPVTIPLYGVGGTVTTLRVMNMANPHYEPGLLEGKILKRRYVTAWRKSLFEMTPDERLKVPGLPASRAHILPAGSVILEAAMKALGKRVLIVSEKGIMFGLAWELYKR